MINMSYCRTENVIAALREWLEEGSGDLTKRNLETLLVLSERVAHECKEELEDWHD